jgi:hypothetical protein
MALQGTQPENKSFLSPIGFQFGIQKLPHVNYFCTAAGIPDISLGQVDTIDNTFIKLPTPGDKLTFGALNITFQVDEDLKNFKEIYDWMIGLGFPDNFQQSAAIGRTLTTAGEIYSDASLIILTGGNTPNIEVKYIDVYPVSLSALDFDLQATDIDYLKATATFAYRKYDLTTMK